jgi:hypothetical protein
VNPDTVSTAEAPPPRRIARRVCLRTIGLIGSLGFAYFLWSSVYEVPSARTHMVAMFSMGGIFMQMFLGLAQDIWPDEKLGG